MTTATKSPDAITIARDYYNSADADNFYSCIWGGEDIHVGLYESPTDSIFEASRRTIERICASIRNPGPDLRILDIGSGYGGAARYLAQTYGCQVVALNLSEVENERARRMTREQGLDHLVHIMDGSFENIPQQINSFDVVWSQDAILHSPDRALVISEVARVLKPGGQFLFTDPMQADDCPQSVLRPILDRIHLQSLGSPSFYQWAAHRFGLIEVGFQDLSCQLVIHYSRVLQEMQHRLEELIYTVSSDYIKKMKKGLAHWIDGGNKRHLVWGIFHFRKPTLETSGLAA